MPHAKHVVLTPLGSLGDLHPFMALGLGLQARGHRVTLATSRVYQDRILGAGLGFSAVGPEPDLSNPHFYQRLFDPVSGPEYLFRQWLLPALAETYQDLAKVLASADYLVNSPLMLPGPLLAQSMDLPWAAVNLQPMGYLSAFDPPTLAPYPWSAQWYDAPPWLWQMILGLGKASTQPWLKPYRQFCQARQLTGGMANPIFEGQFSPTLNLAL